MNCGTLKGLQGHKSRNEYPCKFCLPFRDATHVPTPSPPAKCGTVNGRAKHRRDGTPICDPCRIAYNAYQRARSSKRPRTAQVAGEIVHGTVWGYQQHKARGDADCPPCREAANTKRREYNTKKAEKQ